MNTGKKYRVVCDTNVYVSALFWTGQAHELITLALQGKIEIVISPAIVDELKSVLLREFIEEEKEVDPQLAFVENCTRLVHPSQDVSVVADDPDDNKIISCALEAKASSPQTSTC